MNNKDLLIGKLIQKLNPLPLVGGLEISGTVLRFLLLGGKKQVLREAKVRLPAGTVVDGRVKNRSQFVAALKQLAAQIRRRSPIDVIVSIPAVNVYLQTFTLPAVTKEKLEEVARLNLQMISPVDMRSVYSDWEVINRQNLGRGQPVDLLGGFVAKEIIDELSADLKEAGFNVVAIEPAPLSLARILAKWLKDPFSPCLVLNLSSDGLDFFIFKGGKLHFNYFVSWSSFGSLTLTNLESIIDQELRRLINFYTRNWGGVVKKMALVGMADNREIFEYIKRNISLEIIQAKTSPVLGAALRGLIPRAKDHLISLAKMDTEESFFQSRVLTFVRFWRNMAMVVLIATAAIYGMFDFVAIQLMANLRHNLALAPQMTSFGISVKQLEKEADVFNILVDKIAAVTQEKIFWPAVFRDLYTAAAGREIILRQVQVQHKDAAVMVSGQANSERGILNFKNALSQNSRFTDVFLPLTAIKSTPNGKASFKISLKVKS